MRLTLYSLADGLTYGLVASVSFGQLEQWTGLLNANLWLLHFFFTLVVLSLFIIAAEKQFLRLRPAERNSLFYLMVALAVWYLQRIYVLKHEATDGFEEGCRRDLLLTTSVITASVITLSSVSVFAALVFLT